MLRENALTAWMYERLGSISCVPKCFMKPRANALGGSVTNSGVMSITASPFRPCPTISKVRSRVGSVVASTPCSISASLVAEMSWVMFSRLTVLPRRVQRTTRLSTSVPGAIRSAPPDTAANSVLSSMSRSYMLSGISSRR